jgi:hypothetical protein
VRRQAPLIAAPLPERLKAKSFRGCPVECFEKGGLRLARHTIDEVPALNCHRLHHAGALQPGQVSRWVWVDDLALTMRAEVGRLVIAIGDQAQVVPLHRRAGTLGGEFVGTFHCPRCGRKVWTLYLRDGRLACRHCPPRLDYASHLERGWGSPVLSRIRWLRRRYGADDLRPLAPLRRRAGWASRWYDEILALEAVALAEFERTIAVIERRTGPRHDGQRQRRDKRPDDAG